MGKCSSVIRGFKVDQDQALIEKKQVQNDENYGKQHQIMMKKIDLINNWQSYELETIVEKIMMMCEYQKKNHMNFTLFLQFFPALKPMSMKTQIRYFDLFDFTRSSYINIRQIIFGISQIYFTPKSQYSQVLKQIYKRSKGENLSASQFKLFFHQNKDLLDVSNKGDNQKSMLAKQTIQEMNFDLMIAKYFKIIEYQRYFDFYDTDLEISILNSIRSSDNVDKNDDAVSQSRISSKKKYKNDQRMQQKKGGSYSIRIRNGERVFLVTKNWFESWVKYMAIHGCYEIIYQIQKKNDTLFQRRNFSFDEVFMQNVKFVRPPKIYNYDLLSEYETDLRSDLTIFEDFIPLPEKMWKKLISIYKGGPEIQRVYPYLFETIVINKVYIDNKGKFIEGKVIRCILQPQQQIDQLFKNESKPGHLYFKRVPTFSNQGAFEWQELQKSTKADDSLHHSFAVFIPSFAVFIPNSLKALFELNYKSSASPASQNAIISDAIQKQSRFSYGEKLSFRTYAYCNSVSGTGFNQYLKLNAYIVDIRKNDVKVHFVGYSDTCDDYYSIEELSKGIDPTKNHIVTNKNIVTAFQGLDNCSYINATLQVLIASPFFSDYFLKQKHVRSLSHDTNLQSCLSTAFSKVIYDVKRHQKQSVMPEDLYKRINSKVQQINFDIPGKEYAEKFISKFLETLTLQLGNPQKLFDKYPLVTNFEDDKNQKKNQKFKGSIIEAFFKLSQSTKSICSTCKTESIDTSYSYTLKVPIPADEQIFYSIIFCPINGKNFVKYGITIRKSQKFIKYAQKFSELIQIQMRKLCFAEVRNNQFRRHYTKFDYYSSLFNIDLNPSDTIYVFQLRNQNFSKQITQDQENFTDKFLKLSVGDIVDFNLYTEWHVGKIMSINEKDKIVILNFDGESQMDKKRIDSFKNKTQEKNWQQIDLLHRRINKKDEDRIQYFLNPSVITIAEWMNWRLVFGIIKNYLKNYFNISQKNQSKFLNRLANFLNGLQGNSVPQNELQKSDCIFNNDQSQDGPSSRSFPPQVDTSMFAIKILLKNSGEICAICGKKSIFKKQNGHLDSKYCYGCSSSLDFQQAIGIRVNPAKITIMLDWVPVQAQCLMGIIQRKIKQHTTYEQVKRKINKQTNTIDDCFQLYIQTNKKVQIDCDKCGRGFGEQTRYLSQCPNMLILHLNRFKTYKNQENKLNNRIEIKRQLTIQKIQMQSKKEDIYELYGIICHRQAVKQEMQSEKWNVWVKCQDTHATLIDFDRIERNQIYLLFYRKKNIKCTILSMIF